MTLLTYTFKYLNSCIANDGGLERGREIDHGYKQHGTYGREHQRCYVTRESMLK